MEEEDIATTEEEGAGSFLTPLTNKVPLPTEIMEETKEIREVAEEELDLQSSRIILLTIDS